MRTGTNTFSPSERDMVTCPRCNSTDLEPFSGEETQWEEGFECQRCGLRFEAEEERDAGFEAFCQEQSEL